eukprot:s2053_g6.t1
MAEIPKSAEGPLCDACAEADMCACCVCGAEFNEAQRSGTQYKDHCSQCSLDLRNIRKACGDDPVEQDDGDDTTNGTGPITIKAWMARLQKTNLKEYREVFSRFKKQTSGVTGRGKKKAEVSGGSILQFKEADEHRQRTRQKANFEPMTMSRFFEKSKIALVEVDDHTDLVPSGNGAKGKAKIKKEIENKKKKEAKCDIPTLKVRTSSRLLPHMRFLSTALKDAHVKYEDFKKTFAAVYDIFEKISASGIAHEESVEIHKFADSDQVGLIKLLGQYLPYYMLLFTVERRFLLVLTISLGSKEESLYVQPEFDQDDFKDEKLRDFKAVLESDTYLHENAPGVKPYQHFAEFDSKIAQMTTKSEINEAWDRKSMKDMESTKSSLDKARQKFEDQRAKLNKETGSGRLNGRTNLNALQLSETDYPIIRGYKATLVPNGDDEATACEKIIQKLKTYLPEGWDSILDQQQLANVAGEDPALITASKDVLSAGFHGGVKGTSFLGCENSGIGTWRVQLSGGRLIAMANVNECLQHFRTTNISEAKQCLAQMDPSTMPDALALPSLYFVYLRTGDCLLTPSGTLIVDKDNDEIDKALEDQDQEDQEDAQKILKPSGDTDDKAANSDKDNDSVPTVPETPPAAATAAEEPQPKDKEPLNETFRPSQSLRRATSAAGSAASKPSAADGGDPAESPKVKSRSAASKPPAADDGDDAESPKVKSPPKKKTKKEKTGKEKASKDKDASKSMSITAFAKPAAAKKAK